MTWARQGVLGSCQMGQFGCVLVHLPRGLLGMAHGRLVNLDEVVAWTSGGLGMQSLCGACTWLQDDP